jgi:hypothetical protein
MPYSILLKNVFFFFCEFLIEKIRGRRIGAYTVIVYFYNKLRK